MTNPPWQEIYTEFARQAFKLADHMVFLTHYGAIGTTARIRDYLASGHRIKEIVHVDPAKAGFPGGLVCVATHWQRGYQGDCRMTYWI